MQTNEAADAVAANGTVTLSGKEYIASPFTDKEFIEFDRWIQSRVVANAIAGLPSRQYIVDANELAELNKLRSEILQAASLASIGVSWASTEGNAILNTPEGMAHLAWMMFKNNHLGLTKEQIYPLIFNAENSAKIGKLFAELNRKHLGNMSGENSTGL